MESPSGTAGAFKHGNFTYGVLIFTDHPCVEANDKSTGDNHSGTDCKDNPLGCGRHFASQDFQCRTPGGNKF